MTKREYSDVYDAMLLENISNESSLKESFSLSSSGNKGLGRIGSAVGSADEKLISMRKVRSPKRFRRLGTPLQSSKTDEKGIICKSRCDNSTLKSSNNGINSSLSPDAKCSGGDDVIRIVRWKCDLCHTTDLEENYVLYADGRVKRKQNYCNKCASDCNHEKKTLLYVFHR